MPDEPSPDTMPRPEYVKRLRRWRFAMILIVLTVAVVAAAAAGWRFARTSSAPSNGPIIFISIDTLRADHLPVYGYRNVPTPAIDALAAEGVVFEHAYAHSPQTLPSHVCILSGQLPFETGVRDDIGFALNAETRLLPQLLKRRGYTGGAVVSSCLLRRETGLAAAFDFYDSEMPVGPDGQRAIERPAPDSVAVAQKWIASLSSPRFFLFLHLDEPHAPYTPPARFAQYAPYDGEIAYSDEAVGRFLHWLKDRGLYDRATIVLLSDHGEGLGNHGEQEHGLLLHDDTIRVPLIVKLPRDVNHGHRVAAPVQHLDLVPTILDLLDLAKPPALGGRSLRALLEGRQAPLASQPLYAESFYGRFRFGLSGLRATTEGGTRYIDGPKPELYDLAQDPAEQRNLMADDGPGGRAERETLREMIAGDTTPPRPSPTREERQRAAGAAFLSLAPRLPESARDSDLPDPAAHVATVERSRQAFALAAERRYKEAIAAYRDIAATDPELEAVWLQLGDALSASGRPAEAVDAFKRAAETAPSDATPLLYAAEALLRSGKSDAARVVAADAVKRAGDGAAPAADAHALLARIAIARNEPAEATHEAELALKKDPATPIAAFVKAMLLQKAGKHDEAAGIFEQAVQADARRSGPLPDLRPAYAETLMRLDRYSEAETRLKEEIALFPRSVAARTSLAMLCRAQHRDEDARRAIEEMLAAVPTPDAYTAATRLWTILGEKDRAVETRAAAKERFGTDAPAVRTRGAHR